MPHKIDELLYTVRLPIYIDAILDSTGDSEVPPTPQPPPFPCESAHFTSIFRSVSILFFFSLYFKIWNNIILITYFKLFIVA
jgi:hypothetical protein